MKLFSSNGTSLQSVLARAVALRGASSSTNAISPMSLPEHSIEEEALDYVRNYGLDDERARQVVRSQHEQRLPDGLATEGHFLYYVEKDDGQPIGYVWYFIDRGESFAWLDAIEIYEDYRGQGYGGQVLSFVEAELSADGIRSTSLHVAGDNERARKFYERHGYKITGYNMKKDW